MSEQIIDRRCKSCGRAILNTTSSANSDECYGCRNRHCSCGNKKAIRAKECGYCRTVTIEQQVSRICRVCKGSLGSDEWIEQIREERQRLCFSCYPKHKAKRRQIRIGRNSKLRAEVLAAYGSLCTCCGEFQSEFLTIDHIYGDGHAERKPSKGSAKRTYPMLKKMGFPQDRYQCLCMNCNWTKSRNAECPHRKQIRDLWQSFLDYASASREADVLPPRQLSQAA